MMNTDPYAELDRLVSEFAKAANLPDHQSMSTDDASYGELNRLLGELSKSLGFPDLPDDRRTSSRKFSDSSRRLNDYADDRQRQLEEIRAARQQLKSDFEAGRMQPRDVMLKETELNQRESSIMAKVAPIVAAAARSVGVRAAGTAMSAGSSSPRETH